MNAIAYFTLLLCLVCIVNGQQSRTLTVTDYVSSNCAGALVLKSATCDIPNPHKVTVGVCNEFYLCDEKRMVSYKVLTCPDPPGNAILQNYVDGNCLQIAGPAVQFVVNSCSPIATNIGTIFRMITCTESSVFPVWAIVIVVVIPFFWLVNIIAIGIFAHRRGLNSWSYVALALLFGFFAWICVACENQGPVGAQPSQVGVAAAYEMAQRPSGPHPVYYPSGSPQYGDGYYPSHPYDRRSPGFR
jgi:hypothetical protein